MITTGSKLLIGSALAATVFAIVYGVTQGGTLGTIGLASAAIALALLAGINTWVRDSNVSAMDTEAFAAAAAAQATARATGWPLLAGIGATAVVLGLTTYRTIFILGMGVLFVAAAEWLVQSWSERASADRGYNDHARDYLIDPLELPLIGAAGAAVLIYSFSRVMLGVPSKTATVITFSVVAGLVLMIGAVIGFKRETSRSALTGTFGVAAIVLVGTGTFFGLRGERETHPHHTAGDIAEENECGPEETEADELASQRVAAKSSVAADVIFDGAELTFDLPGYDGTSDDLFLPRSTSNHILFTNDSDAPARLVIEMHPRLDDDDQPIGPERICTTLVDEGGTQFLTLEFARPSRYVEGGYVFTVPGSDATLEVIVP